jgi:hypothetical protein
MSLPFDRPATMQQRLHALSSYPKYKFRNGKQIRFLAYDLGDTTLLNLHFSHQCADGLCVTTNCERFMQLLDPKVPVEEKPLKSITSLWMKSGDFEKYKDKVQPFNFDHLGKFTPLRLPRQDTTDYSQACFHHQCPELSPLRVKTLLQRARNHQSTFMGITWAACAVGSMTLMKLYGQELKFPTNFLFRTPVNLRGIYPKWGVENKDFTFGSFPIMVPMKIDENTSIWDIAAYTRKEMMNNINEHVQERQFFCRHSMGDVIAPEPENTVNGTSIGAFKFREVYPSGHSVSDVKLMVTYALTPANALIHFDAITISHLGMKFNIAYMYPCINDHEGAAYANAVQHTIDLMTDCDKVTIGDLQDHLMLR